MKQLLIALLLLAPSAFAQLVEPTAAGVVVATPGTIELEGGWRVEGVASPQSIAANERSVAVLDPLANSVVIVDLATGASRREQTDETPTQAVFIGDALYVLARDAATLRRVGGPAIPVAADPAFLRASGSRIYVYSRTAGVLQEIEHDRVTRRMEVPPFASDFEMDGTTAYFAYPRDARIRTVDLGAMQIAGELAVGAVPVDIAFAGGGSAITARILAVADPSAKRVWFAEAEHSMGKAIARGFLRGLLGLGLFGSRGSEFPTGVDRVEVAGDQRIAYDSSSGTLYRFDRRTSSVLATDVAPRAFAVTGDGVVWWSDGQLHRAD